MKGDYPFNFQIRKVEFLSFLVSDELQRQSINRQRSNLSSFTITSEVMMNPKDDHQQFLPKDHSDDPMIIEVPADPKPPYQEKIPSGYDPMGEIHLRGRAYRGLAGGRIPWWVLISGWIIFGGVFLMVLIPMLTSAAWELIPILIFASLPIVILWRGTASKLAARKYNRR